MHCCEYCRLEINGSFGMYNLCDLISDFAMYVNIFTT
jgi:hypothetical protein